MVILVAKGCVVILGTGDCIAILCTKDCITIPSSQARLAGWLACWLAAWLPGCLAGCMASWKLNEGYAGSQLQGGYTGKSIEKNLYRKVY